jgi:hypothetical protein
MLSISIVMKHLIWIFSLAMITLSSCGEDRTNRDTRDTTATGRDRDVHRDTVYIDDRPRDRGEGVDIIITD